MKKTFVFLVVVILAVCAFFLFQFLQKNNVIGHISSKPLTSSNETVQENNEQQRYAIDVSYPVFSGSFNTTLQEKLNSSIKSLIDGEIDSFKNAVQNMDLSLVPKEYSNQLTISYEPFIQTSNMVSIEFTISQFWAGAAHPNSVAKTFTYDISSGKQLSLSNIFKKNSNYLSVLSGIATQSLKEKLGKDLEETDDVNFMKDWIETGAAPKKENFSNFVLGKDNLIIIFDPYQVGPYAWGFQKVEIPYEKIQDTLAIQPENF